MKEEPMKLKIDPEALRRVVERVNKEQAEIAEIIEDLGRKHALKLKEEQSSKATGQGDD